MGSERSTLSRSWGLSVNVRALSGFNTPASAGVYVQYTSISWCIEYPRVTFLAFQARLERRRIILAALGGRSNLQMIRSAA
jgi:hypothetical protein